MVQVGRGRHSGFLFSGVTKPLRAYVESSSVCVYWLFLFCWAFGSIRAWTSFGLSVGLLSPYGLMWNLAGSVFMGCFGLFGL